MTFRNEYATFNQNKPREKQTTNKRFLLKDYTPSPDTVVNKSVAALARAAAKVKQNVRFAPYLICTLPKPLYIYSGFFMSITFDLVLSLAYFNFGNIIPKMQKILHSIIFHILRPLVRILHRGGVSFGEFSQIARQVYVETAEAALLQAGEKATTSRIAITTGLTRKDVAQLRQSEAGAELSETKYNRGVRVISAWLSDAEFLDAQGDPAVLLLQGQGKSFEALVSRYSGDMPYRAMLKEFEHSGLVQLSDDGKVSLLSDAYIPKQDEAEKLAILGSDVSLLINTIDHNLQRTDETPYFQRKVSYDNLPSHAVEAFKEMVSQDSMALLLKFNKWLAEHDRDSNPESQGTGKITAGVGIYYFEQSIEADNDQSIKDSKHAS